MKTRGLTNVGRFLVAGFAALALSVALLEYPGHGRGAAAAGQPSSKIAVVPGFVAPKYPDNTGQPPLPVGSPEFANYHFTELPTSMVTTAALKAYDTVILYGIRWSDISASGQAAINEFATAHKVIIWDSDGTGAQSYSNFIHPFATLSSGQNYAGKPNESVVSFPTGLNFLASDDPASPYFLYPYEFVKDGDLINDMNAMKTGTPNWRPALFAANKTIPNGGWALAWSYGVIADQTGMTIYSGLDADSFIAPGWKLNNDKKELALQLAAPVRSAAASCAPNCQLPPPTKGKPYAVCSFAKPLPPKHWVHGRVPVVLKTSVAAGITGQIVTRSGRVIARGTERSGNLLRLVVPTKKLPSNRVSRLQAVVLLNGEPACTQVLQLKVDNVRPRLLRLITARGAVDLLSLRVSERSWLKIVGRHVHWRTRRIAPRTMIHLRLPTTVRRARLILHDRAGNTVARRLVWR